MSKRRQKKGNTRKKSVSCIGNTQKIRKSKKKPSSYPIPHSSQKIIEPSTSKLKKENEVCILLSNNILFIKN